MSEKILIIGIDGGTWSVLRPAMDADCMPYLKSLVESGASGILESTMPPVTPAAWGAFQTGMNPGNNGIYEFHGWDRRKKKPFLVSSKNLETTIWDQASQSGKRVGIINVPMTYPPKPINGYMITGILTPSLDSEFTYPADLRRELLETIPGYHILRLGRIEEDSAHNQFESYIQRMIKTIDNRARAARFIMEKDSLDLFMVHFQATDFIQHVLWDCLDQAHPLHNPKRRHYIFDKFYRQLDHNIKNVRQTFEKQGGDNLLTFVISDHGFQANKKRFFLGKWLHRKGFLKLNLQARVLHQSLEIAGKTGLEYLIDRASSPNTFRKLEQKLRSKRRLVDWDRSKAIAVAAGEGFIYLLDNNESDRHKTAQELTTKLENLRDPEDGSLITAAVHRKEDIFRGKFMEQMPDLIVEPAAGYSFYGGYKEKLKVLYRIKTNNEAQVGKHHKDGILIATGKHVTPQKDIRAQIVDIAPTILYYLGLPVRQDSDGRIRKDFFTQQFQKENPVDLSLLPETKSTEQIKNNDIYSTQEEQQIEKRLEDLGYL